tara:strand:- start:234 stop:473 length:240 start_codon:yes stop_codon:yes gene_type:complete
LVLPSGIGLKRNYLGVDIKTPTDFHDFERRWSRKTEPTDGSRWGLKYYWRVYLLYILSSFFIHIVLLGENNEEDCFYIW